jgi:hypothetical protein
MMPRGHASAMVRSTGMYFALSSVLDGSHHPGGPPAAVIAIVIGAVLTLAIVLLWLHMGNSGPGPGDSDDDSGGGGRRPPEPPPPADPGWWPEFERDFAAYVAPTREKQL